ncbi:hypothetical protein [Deinococcus ficus]|uniref:Uncharacterized protein n=1 Tax=Deinococcus ficus TaxID=317577 RepID=A0A221T2X4_9DEIO|nr:hypothetical protein [Deinococcus ficus]ASN83254.1 hypothetical protein DFI_18830 [Deinococcus ficus]
MFGDLQRNLDRPVKCPKCRSSEILLTEQAVRITLRYRQTSDNTLERQQLRKRMIDSSVEGYCERCCHTWKVRGIQHVNELRYAFCNRKNSGSGLQKNGITDLSERMTPVHELG